MQPIYQLVPTKFGTDEIEAAMASLKTDQWTMGPSVRSFEQEFAKSIGMKYAVMVNSGSSANLIAYTSFFFRKNNPLERGDEVLVPALAWATTWAPLWQLGLKARVVDIDPETLNVETDAFRKAITPNTKMIVGCSILGNPADLAGTQALCKEKGLIFMEDNCESIGSLCGSGQCGTFGEVNTFSFFYSHHIATIEGGMVATNSEEMYGILLALRAHGWTRDLPADNPIMPKATSSFPAYNFLLPGYNVRPIELTAAIGRVQLPKLQGMIDGRRKNRRKFEEILSKYPNLVIQREKYGKGSWFAFTMYLKKGNSQERDRLYEVLRQNGIESRMVTGGSFMRHPMAKFFEGISTNGGTPVADMVHDNGVFVGNHDFPLDEQLKRLDEALAKFHKG